MGKKVILIGTNHLLQCGIKPYSKSQISKFRSYVSGFCLTEGIKQIAEEMDTDGLESQGVKDTIFASVANDLSIEHIYVDISRDIRGELEISEFRFGVAERNEKLQELLTLELSSQVRERVWFARLLAKNIWPTLFICGATHVKSMQALINKCALECEIAQHDYNC